MRVWVGVSGLVGCEGRCGGSVSPSRSMPVEASARFLTTSLVVSLRVWTYSTSLIRVRVRDRVRVRVRVKVKVRARV